MSNILDNGSVLPHGLLSVRQESAMEGFNKSYKNTSLRVGIVVASFPVGDDNNVYGLTTEYNVIIIEQVEDRGVTSILYRNCMSSEGLGSIADYFEKSLRPMKTNSNPGGTANTKGQDGSVVLVLCLDGLSNKGIIVGSLTHPDRDTNLTSEGPILAGEFNGVNIIVNEDGSTTLTFKGATKSDGTAVDSSQGNTEIKIEKDGSYQVDHKTITQRLDKNGQASLTATDNISNITQKDFNVNAQGNIGLTASKDFTLNSNNATINAQGSASLMCQALSVQAQSNIMFQAAQMQVQAAAMVGITAPVISLNGQVSLGGPGGQPMLLSNSMFIGIGNLGSPVISVAFSGFSTKTTAT